MLKISCIVDKEGTALDRLGKGVVPYMDNVDYEVIDVHPKRPSPGQLERFEARADSDIFDWQYFRTAELLRSKYDLKGKHILTHNNPYSIKESDWNSYDTVVGNNKEIYEALGEITTAPTAHIPLTVDTDFWTFKREWQPNKNVLMVANRIESKKGILPVAQACKELGLKMILVGAVSDMDYFRQIIATGVVEPKLQISDKELRDLYWNSTWHVTNSVDNFESGTLPLLEAMLCGTPVITRKVGHAPELYNGENMIINEGEPEDIKKALEEALKANLDKQRNKAWDTAKTRSHERRAYMYQKLYRQVMWPDQKSVSVVMPIYGSHETTRQTIRAVGHQTYQNIELIVCIDDPEYKPIDLGGFRTPLVRFIDQPSKGYGLAKQRNLGVIEATGDIIVFCDQRIKMQPDAVEKLVAKLVPKRWVYGSKGVKKDFVENFSAVHRNDLIRLGLFGQYIDRYGGMSQDIRSRAKLNGFYIEYVAEAKAEAIGNSKRRFDSRQDIIKMKNRLWKMELEL